MNTTRQVRADSAAQSSAPVHSQLLQRRCACGGAPGVDGECAQCREKRLQRKIPADVRVEHTPPIVDEVLHSAGQPLDAGARTLMEPRFGHDFSEVRVHTDAKAVESAEAVNASAYTVGNDIVFGAGQHSPETTKGKQLLAHELAHVVQQGRGSTGASTATEGSLEREADTVAQTAIDGSRPIQVIGASPSRIARQTKGVMPSSEPKPVAALPQVEESPLPGGRVQIRVWGTVGDPVPRSGFEKKYPDPGTVGLPGYDRWHLVGPNALGAEAGIVYVPKNFNVSATAKIENVVRNARAAVREYGGDVYFDFQAQCRVVGVYEGVEVRVLEKVTWQAEVRPAGSDKLIPILNETASPTGVGTFPPKQTQGPPSGAAPSASGPQPHSEGGPSTSTASASPGTSPPTTPKISPVSKPSTTTPHAGGSAPAVAAPKPPTTAPGAIGKPSSQIGFVAPKASTIPQIPESEFEQPVGPKLGAGRGGHGVAIGAAAAEFVIALLDIAVRRYLAEKYEKELEEHAEKKIREALEKEQERFKTTVSANESQIKEWKSAGRPVILVVGLQLEYQGTDIGAVLMSAKVSDVQIAAQGLPRPQLKEAPRPSFVESFINVSVGRSLQYMQLELPLKETRE